MDSTAPSNQPAAGDAVSGGQFSSSIDSVSYFQKTICLQDWWLIKVDTNGQGLKLGVAGFAARDQSALRLFSSAPIAKYYDMCTLETMDGICVILNGLINKSRTLENGFPSEVFTYFVMGFPPYWEKFAEGYFRRGSTADVVSREDAGRNSLSRGSPENSSKDFGESRNTDCENLSKGAEDSVDMIQETGLHETAFNESSEPIINTDSGLNSKDKRNLDNLVDDVILDKVAFESAPPETSRLNIDSVCTVNKSPVVEPNCIDTEYSESLGNSKRSVKDVMSFENPASVSYDKGKSLSVDGSILLDLAVENRDLEEAAVSLDGRVLCPQLRKSERILQNALGVIDSVKKADRPKKEKNTGRPKKENKAGRSTSKLGVLGQKNCSKNEVKGKVEVAKDASASGKKTKRKLNYESPARQGKEEEPSILPIESLSCKRSRSGRLLLPSLEYWRNQTLVYDADGQIAGIKDDPYTAKGSKSEPPKKKTKRLF